MVSHPSKLIELSFVSSESERGRRKVELEKSLRVLRVEARDGGPIKDPHLRRSAALCTSYRSAVLDERYFGSLYNA
jgi:hypothetical protein